MRVSDRTNGLGGGTIILLLLKIFFKTHDHAQKTSKNSQVNRRLNLVDTQQTPFKNYSSARARPRSFRQINKTNGETTVERRMDED